MQRETIPSARFGAYELVARVGAGGMAEVFRARVPDGSRTVALKLLRLDAPPEAEELFDCEADVMAFLDHPNLVHSLEVGRAGGRRYLAMEDVAGGDLGKLMRAHAVARVGVPMGVAFRVILDVLHGLAYFHRARTSLGEPLGLVHGDVNPANVFLSTTGEVKLGDFGLATATRTDALSLRPVVPRAGKLHYLSPEQVAGEKLSAATDLFAVGVILYELAVGYRPFLAAEEGKVLSQIAGGKLEIPSVLVDEELAPILKRALATSPKDRFASAGELAGELLRYQLDHGLQCSREDLGRHVSAMLG